MSIALKSIAVVLFIIVAILGVTFALGLPLNFIM
jgi:hypothetical protein